MVKDLYCIGVGCCKVLNALPHLKTWINVMCVCNTEFLCTHALFPSCVQDPVVNVSTHVKDKGHRGCHNDDKVQSETSGTEKEEKPAEPTCLPGAMSCE